ncbi:MAG TPA: hypothetical protein VGR73_07210 [Bryobacteraceae bacterium]|nr:hypothetical protein [Bryobacteraceae bacterium]
MRINRAILILFVSSGIFGSLAERSAAQAPASRGAGTATPAPAKASAAAAAPAMQVHASLLQLMRGTLYPASNVLFAAQDKNPADVAPANDPSVAVNPLESSYGKWEAVENSALAIVEVANLLTLPGRKCANGRDVPLRNPDWPKFVQGLRDAGMTAYQAAKSKNQDKIVDAADVITTACANCHNKYRETPTLADRCK